MFQEKLFNIQFFQLSFFFSTIIVQATGQNTASAFPVQENSTPTLAETNIFLIIIVACGCIAMLPLIFILKCILIFYLRRRYKPRERQDHLDNVSNNYYNVRQPRDSCTSEFYYNIVSANAPAKPFEQPRGYYPSNNPHPVIINDHPSLDHSYVGMQPVTIQSRELQPTDNEYEGIDHYEEIIPSKNQDVTLTSTDAYDVDSFTYDAGSTRVINDVVLPSNANEIYEGMLPVKNEYELDSFNSDAGSTRVNAVVLPSNANDDYEGMLPVRNEYELHSLASIIDKPYYDSLGTPLHYDYITIATPPSNKPRKSPVPQLKDSFIYDELSPNHQ